SRHRPACSTGRRSWRTTGRKCAGSTKHAGSRLLTRWAWLASTSSSMTSPTRTTPQTSSAISATRSRGLEMSKDRWHVEIDRAHDSGVVIERYSVEELDEIADIVEGGPDWNTIREIRVRLNPSRRFYDITVEEAAKL